MRPARRGTERPRAASPSRGAARLLAILALAAAFFGFSGVALAGPLPGLGLAEAPRCSLDSDAARRHSERREENARAPAEPGEEKALPASWSGSPAQTLKPRGQQRSERAPASVGASELGALAVGALETAGVLSGVDGARAAELLERVLESRGVRETKSERGPPRARAFV